MQEKTQSVGHLHCSLRFPRNAGDQKVPMGVGQAGSPQPWGMPDGREGAGCTPPALKTKVGSGLTSVRNAPPSASKRTPVN